MENLKEGRSLPTERNPLYDDDTIDYSTLISKCRSQVIEFPDGPATFVRLKCNNPDSKHPHFLMRMARNSNISATSMFRSAFPKAKQEEEDSEMEWIRANLNPVEEKQVSGLWVSPRDALALAKDYGMTPFIKALLEASTSPSTYATPARSHPVESNQPAGASPSTLGKLVGSKAPHKSLEPSESPKKSLFSNEKHEKESKEVQTKIDDTNKSIPSAVTLPASSSSSLVASNERESEKEVKGEETKVVKQEEIDIVKRQPLKKEPKMKGKSQDEQLHLKEEEKVVEDEENNHSSDIPRKVRTPVRPSELLERIRSNVHRRVSDVTQQVKKPLEAFEKKATASIHLPHPSFSVSKKRSRDEYEETQPKEIDEAALIPVKKSRISKLETEIHYEKRKVRALTGIVVGLGAGAILPFLF
ncbi:bouquet formation protein Bqt4 [Schizosaccharomyces cryophilus OY26]|uniref:Bouquet formation protein Bqt4 n=1 Tax=Schizosaccharomyces cryophilus (strain OY26 / ATCC MYA-4695 / CBS 11777 / NBRC 106824 / NRRL Y48691) TaxID=653667 RepID=S9W5K0_SCHCR|nr:bouquet formation protein Bqt4 [Schizosaccharomyces cryophilus OY26]EPY53829.1 bouquet formation protein Bqt4 [Schizosaccharomyces cryophilus OY26]